MAQPVWLALAVVDEDGAARPDGLSASERARLDAISAPRRRAQFVCGRRLARRVLAASVAGSRPADWVLGAGSDTPPRVERAPAAAPGPRFVSITHSGPLVACAVAPVPVGVDLERPRPGRDLTALADAVFGASEQARWRALGPDAREAFFLAVWTLKEAAAKRLGLGLDLAALPDWQTAEQAGGDGEAEGEGRVWRTGAAVLALVAPADAVPRCVGPVRVPGPAERWRIGGLP